MTTLDLHDLPSEPALLQQLVRDLLGTLHDQHRQIEQLQHQVAMLRRHQFGRTSEKIDSDQLLLAFAAVQKAAAADTPASEPASGDEPSEAPKKGHGRRPLPDDLPRERIEHTVPEDDRRCPECGEWRRPIGEEVTEQLDWVPASFVVRQHVRIKYACKPCQGHVVTAELPPMPIEKGRPGAGLIAHVLGSKYADHIPLYRQEGIYARLGVNLPRSVLCDWVRDGAALVEPIVRAMRTEVLASKVIHTDDTPVPVQDRTRPGTREGRLWVYVGDKAHPYTVFDYTPTRQRDGPEAFLGDYKGYLQADAFSGYDAIYATEQVVEVACWAHARRKFFDAKTVDVERSHAALAFIHYLYEVEKKAKDLKPDRRRAVRLSQARPILARFREWLDEQRLTVLPKSPIGQAIGYALNQWGALNRYLDDGALHIDNNAAENALRIVALGRKNWLFAGSDAGGRRAAIIYSLIATCKRHGVEPFAYLRDVLDRVSTHPQSGIAALFPDNWQAAQTEARASSAATGEPDAHPVHFTT